MKKFLIRFIPKRLSNQDWLIKSVIVTGFISILISFGLYSVSEKRNDAVDVYFLYGIRGAKYDSLSDNLNIVASIFGADSQVYKQSMDALWRQYLIVKFGKVTPEMLVKVSSSSPISVINKQRDILGGVDDINIEADKLRKRIGMFDAIENYLFWALTLAQIFNSILAMLLLWSDRNDSKNISKKLNKLSKRHNDKSNNI